MKSADQLLLDQIACQHNRSDDTALDRLDLTVLHLVDRVRDHLVSPSSIQQNMMSTLGLVLELRLLVLESLREQEAPFEAVISGSELDLLEDLEDLEEEVYLTPYELELKASLHMALATMSKSRLDVEKEVREMPIEALKSIDMDTFLDGSHEIKSPEHQSAYLQWVFNGLQLEYLAVATVLLLEEGLAAPAGRASELSTLLVKSAQRHYLAAIKLGIAAPVPRKRDTRPRSSEVQIRINQAIADEDWGDDMAK